MNQSFIYKSLVQPDSITAKTFADMRRRGSVVAQTPLGSDRSVVFDLRSEDVIAALADALREVLDLVRTGAEVDLENLCSRHALAVLVLDELRERDTWTVKERFSRRGRDAIMGSTVRLLLEPGDACGTGLSGSRDGARR